MAEAHAQRHRERLVLSLDEDGLEELTLRLVLPDWPQGHLTRRGPDGGVDVFSDYEPPPARAWQCKNYTDNAVDWGKCKRSLKSALNGGEAPKHYTFVFPRRLNKTEHDYWRKTFVPWAHEEFGSRLPPMDYWDDLADRLKHRPDLVNLLNDGAFGGYFREVMKQTAADGVNPLATAADHIDDSAKAAERAAAIGKRDPHYAYGLTGREADVGDTDLPPDRVRFTFDRSREDALPRYALSLREGDMVREITAAPRDGAEPRPPKVWFSDDETGRAERDHARGQLAKGRPVVLQGPSSGLDAPGLPDKFRGLVDEAGSLRNGELWIGVTQPLTLTITMTLGEHTSREDVTLYRIPELAGDRGSYGGSIGGTILTLDLRPVDDGGDDVEVVFSATGEFDDETPEQALRGFGFARAFAEADTAHFVCDGLLPAEGLTIHHSGVVDQRMIDALRANATVAMGLKELELRVPRGRTMPTSITPRDVMVALTVLDLYQHGEARQEVDEPEFEAPLPPEAKPDDDPAVWMSFEWELPDIGGQPTGLAVMETVEGAAALRLAPGAGGELVLVCRNDGEASIVMRLREAGGDGAAAS